jgi:hypothetical protein
LNRSCEPTGSQKRQRKINRGAVSLADRDRDVAEADRAEARERGLWQEHHERVQTPSVARRAIARSKELRPESGQNSTNSNRERQARGERQTRDVAIVALRETANKSAAARDQRWSQMSWKDRLADCIGYRPDAEYERLWNAAERDRQAVQAKVTERLAEALSFILKQELVS